ncbi:hypothetical protein N7499_003375 [Penicillium canescens]|uniref:Uncharacterized protein n=1 Tax=Penicillium canescens TaxID=5083 RepID=A0AAD6I8M5_PENCN|nr:uncharacterized protein N7446_012302 [Penicillium canescens]KAJ6020084.1 hypothetical protein N7522_000159 [Penicillium canescens]KAJ6038022.1 hypothetical protein N7460_007793 [Penicillium canescens]KAJ6045438.1 hypothetical protein N7446_012302 [Penicillium canescens]KAJ6061121.1 hypothetical protein N7444_001817 [Penicillium canescens]KAJ6090661.1 hypothetical protein N7499_003375 [Penicillium canescens]
MQLTNVTALVLGLLTSSDLAAPPSWVKPATIQLANEQSGANANVAVPVDGVKRPAQELWGHTAVAQKGLVFASSAMLTDFQQTTVCEFTEDPRLDVSMNAEKTYTSFGGGVKNLCSTYVVCKCEGM